MLLGELSSKYESNGDPGCVSGGQGDYGGVSYGAYQFASNPDIGVAQAFTQWLQNRAPSFSDILINAGEAGEETFSHAWRSIAEGYYDNFLALQHEYVKEQYFDRSVAILAQIGFDVLSRSEALQQVLWSRSVQYGPGNMQELFINGAEIVGQDLQTVIDADLIRGIYEVNLTDMSWTAGSPSLRPGLFARFENERADALALLNI